MDAVVLPERQHPKIVVRNDNAPWPVATAPRKRLKHSSLLHLRKICATEFIPTSIIKTADILLDGVEFEIKSPKRFNPNTLEHVVRDAIKQSTNLIIDTSRIRKVHDRRIQSFLIGQIYKNSRIRKLLMITKRGEIIDIKSLA